MGLVSSVLDNLNEVYPGVMNSKNDVTMGFILGTVTASLDISDNQKYADVIESLKSCYKAIDQNHRINGPGNGIALHYFRKAIDQLQDKLEQN